MRKIILVSHGSFAQGLYEAGVMIAGNAALYEVVSLSADSDVLSFRGEFEETLARIPQETEVIVLADLQGGSPFTTAVQVLQEKGQLSDIPVLAGANLPFLLSLSFLDSFGEENLEKAKEDAKNGISQFSIAQDTENEEAL